MSKINWSQGQISDICQMYQTGSATTVIAKKYNCCPGSISKVLKRNGITVSSDKTDAETKKKVCDLYQSGDSFRTIEKKIGVGQGAATTIVKKAGIGVRPPTKKRDVTKADVDLILSLRESGKDLKQIATELDLSVTTVCRYLKLNGVRKIKPIINEETKALFVKLYEQGLTHQEIGEKTGYQKDTVGNSLRRQGIKGKLPTAFRTYNFNQTYFDDINTPNKAYWIGWIMSDGSVSRAKNHLRLRLAEPDKEILEKLNKEIESDKPLSFIDVKKKHPDWQNQWKLSLSSKHMTDTLEAYGLTGNKTFTMKFPEWISEDLVSHMIRGIVDGDGGCYTDKTKTLGIRLRTMRVVGTESIVKGIQKRFDNVGAYTVIRKRHHDRDDNIFTLCCERRDDVLKIRDYLYPPGEYLYLQRKYNKFFELA